MSIFKTKAIKNASLIAKVVALVNSQGVMKKTLKEKYDDGELNKWQSKFVEDVSDDMSEEEVEQLKANIKEDPSIVQTYKNRTMLKDTLSGKLLNKKQFAIDLNYPARGFRAVVAKK